MNGKERIQKTLSHEKADKMPVDYMFEDYRTMEKFAKYYGVSFDDLLEFLGCDVVYCNVMDEAQKFIYNPGMMKYAFEHEFIRRDEKEPYIVYDRWGAGWRTDHDGERPIGNVVLDDIANVDSFIAPDPCKEGQLNELTEFERKYNPLGYAVAVGQYYGLFEKAQLILGYENCMYAHYDNTNEINKLLDKIMDYRIGISKMLVERDIAFGHSGDDYGTQRGPILSLELWREFYKPRLKKIWQIYKDKGLSVVHHSCGDCSMYIDDMLEIGLDGLHPVQSACMNIEALGKRYGNNLVFYGGIDCQLVLNDGTPADVTKNVEHIVKTLGKHGNMVLAPINIMRDVSFENFDALVKAVNKYREF